MADRFKASATPAPVKTARHQSWAFLSKFYVGMVIVAVILGLRVIGVLEILELLAFDRLLRSLGAEQPDESITLISLDKTFIDQSGQNYIKYQDLTSLLEILIESQPTTIGVDVAAEQLGSTGVNQLTELFEKNSNLLTINMIDEPGLTPIHRQSASSSLAEQVGFNNVVVDDDAQVRRTLLGDFKNLSEKTNEDFRFSFAIQVVKKHLETVNGIELTNGQKDDQAMQFDQTEIPRLGSNSGGYSRAPNRGVRTLINYRRGPSPFLVLSAADITAGRYRTEEIKDRIVLLGITDESRAVYFNSSIPTTLFDEDRIVGTELQAHIVSQIISAVLDGRTLLMTLTPTEEFVWIVMFGVLGFGAGTLTTSVLQNLGYLGLGISALWMASYGLLGLSGLWFPVVPCFFALAVNGVVYIAVSQSERRWRQLVSERDQALLSSAAMIQERDKALSSLSVERRRTIEHAFDTIHNGPLQTLADLLRRTRDQDLPYQEIHQHLIGLNQEIRSIGETLKQEAINQADRLYLSQDVQLDLQTPLHELFYEVYIATLKREFPGFSHLQVQARAFDPINEDFTDEDATDEADDTQQDAKLTVECKRKLCLFLQEALCNVGKHAQGATRLTVTGKNSGQGYLLTIKDNGCGLPTTAVTVGQGTQLGLEAEKQLGGVFTREAATPKGTLCQLSFPLRQRE